MIVDVIKKTTVEIEEFWVIRGVRDKAKKEVIAEHRMPIEPNALAIAQFLTNHPEADFCSVSHDYELKKGE